MSFPSGSSSKPLNLKNICLCNSCTQTSLYFLVPIRLLTHRPSPSRCSTSSSLLGLTMVCPSTLTLWSSSFSMSGRWSWTAQLHWWFIAGVCERLGVRDHVLMGEGLRMWLLSMCLHVSMCGWMQSVIYIILLDLLLHSAGVGRTGTFIAVDAMMQRLKEKDDLDIYNFVTQMRTKWTFMVQNLVRSYRRTAIWVFSFGFLTTACGRGQNKAITYELQSARVIAMCVVCTVYISFSNVLEG